MSITTWSNASKAEIAQRARAARLGLERVERSLLPPAHPRRERVMRGLHCVCSGIARECTRGWLPEAARRLPVTVSR